MANVTLEVGGSLTWTGPVHTDDATLNVRSLSTQIMPQWVGDLVGGNLEANGTFHGVGMDVPQTSTLAFGLRYAKKLDRPADDIGDRLSTERFDVELDTVVTLSNNVDSFDVTLPPNSGSPDGPVGHFLPGSGGQSPPSLSMASAMRGSWE